MVSTRSTLNQRMIQQRCVESVTYSTKNKTTFGRPDATACTQTIVQTMEAKVFMRLKIFLNFLLLLAVQATPSESWNAVVAVRLLP